jgi:phospholipase/carboxylesterase
MIPLDGPRLEPANGGPATSLVVLLHGYGADGNDLIDIGRALAPLMRGTAFVSPHAPEACADAPMGRQWFHLSLADLDQLWPGVRQAAPSLNAFLDAELTRLGLSEQNLAVLGFSQGAMMALHVGPRRQAPVAGIIGYSGYLAGPEHLGEAPHRPPILLVHGEDDRTVPVLALHAAAPALKAAGFPVEWHVRPGLGHGIDMDGLRLGAEFLLRVLKV